MSRPVDAMGVIRQTFTITSQAPDIDADPELVGSLVLAFPDDELVEGDFTIYTLGADRLRSMLDQAAAGEDIDGLLLSLDAVALASDQDDDDA